MTGILADANIEGHLDFLFDLLTSKAWIEFWQALGIRYATFKEIGLTADDTDDVVWQACPYLRWPTPNAFATTEHTRNGSSPCSWKSCSTLIAIEAAGGFTCHESSTPSKPPPGKKRSIPVSSTRGWKNDPSKVVLPE